MKYEVEIFSGSASQVKVLMEKFFSQNFPPLNIISVTQSETLEKITITIIFSGRQK